MQSLNLDITSFPKKKFYVRKRITGDNIYLIYLSQIYRIDELSHEVWRRCDGQQTVFEIMNDIVQYFPTVKYPELLEAGIRTLSFFIQKKLIEIIEQEN